jgi:hypothetical protein
MTHRPDRVATYSASFSNLTLGKAGELAESLKACHHPSVLIYPALELDLMIDWPLLQLAPAA